MATRPFTFDLQTTDATTCARTGLFHTPHGEVPTPTFMPVGTLGSVKGLHIDQVRATGAKMLLANTYHLALRPGETVVQQLGGLHKFMNWDSPILTDSGGFQLFSLAKLTKVTDHSATFRSHIDGSLLELSPERAVEIQEALGSDIAMVLDHVLSLPATRDALKDASDRTIRWAKRCKDAATRSDQALFGIVQGGLDNELRIQCAEALIELDFPGYAIGGLSVGESPAEMYRVLDVTCDVLPKDRPRYLMGVGRPQDLLEGIRRGVDMFDCVMPTRNGRNALAFTDDGPLRLRNACHETDDRPLDEKTVSPASNYSRGYIRHLFAAGEMLGPILLSIHNLAYYQRLMIEARQAICDDRYQAFHDEKMRGWGGLGQGG
mgnify:FL=1